MSINQDFDKALAAFVKAAQELSLCMERDHTGEYFIAGYPKRLPSFDEFVAELQAWKSEQSEASAFAGEQAKIAAAYLQAAREGRIRLLGCFQDGDVFYEDPSGQVIFQAPNAKGDHMEAAYAARAAFAQRFTAYVDISPAAKVPA